jgi:hypothetical protein
VGLTLTLLFVAAVIGMLNLVSVGFGVAFSALVTGTSGGSLA